jgi:hypothetical protein
MTERIKVNSDKAEEQIFVLSFNTAVKIKLLFDDRICILVVLKNLVNLGIYKT